MAERGVTVDHATIYRRVQACAPEIERRLRWNWKRPGLRRSCKVDETCVKVKGRWTYLYRAVTDAGRTIDFYLSQTRNAKTANATLKGFEVMRALKKGQAALWQYQDGVRGEVRLVERAFGIGPSGISKAMRKSEAQLTKAAA